MHLLKKVEDFCLEYDMLPRSTAIIAAVSGGADSMCLLALLSELSVRHGFHLAACHFNHRLRGDESDGDAAFVAEYCRGLGIHCFEGSGDVRAWSSQQGCGIEEAARQLRYAFFEDCSKKLGGAPVATAHNADDNAETFIMNLMRGAGGRGLGGIPPRRGIYVRPLLGVTRSEIEDYLGQKGIPHREDSTNALDDTLRNRIRHHLSPRLKELCPRWTENVAEASRLARQDDMYLDSLAQKFIDDGAQKGAVSAAQLNALPAAISTRVVRLMAGVSLSRQHTMAVLSLAASDDPSAQIDLPGLRVRREYDRLIFGAAEELTFTPRQLVCAQWAQFPELGGRILLEKGVFDGSVNNSFTTYLFKKSEVCGNITVRPRLSGDSIKLSGRGTKSLKKLFIEKKIPAVLRSRIPVIADDRGVLAVIGIGADVRAAAAVGDEIYKLSWEDIEP